MQELFSTKYQLSFNSVMNRGGTASTKELVVGRSRQCDMVLDYRYDIFCGTGSRVMTNRLVVVGSG